MISTYALLLLVVGYGYAVPIIDLGCRNKFKRLRVDINPENIVDLTYDFDENSPYWPNNPSGFELTTMFAGFVFDPVQFFYRMKSFSQPEHLGTHMDAPSHFSEQGNTAEMVQFSNLVGPGILINLKNRTTGERFPADSLIEVKHILEWERENEGRMRSGSIVMLYTGYGEVYHDRATYFGTTLNGSSAVEDLHFPGLSPEAAEWLVKNRCIAAVGIDTASIDRGQASAFESHRVLNGANIPMFENVANLDKLAELDKKFKIIALPQKISGGSGAPLRIIAAVG